MTNYNPSTGKYETRSSGKTSVYGDGMKRDSSEGKPRFDLMWPEGVPYDEQLMTRVAALYMRGGIRYGDRNWEKSSTTESLDHHKAALLRHVFKFLCGVDDGEDHAAAVVWNVNAVDLTRRNIKASAVQGAGGSGFVGWDNQVTRESELSSGWTLQFAAGDYLVDQDDYIWTFAADGSWWCEELSFRHSSLGNVAEAAGPLLVRTGSFAGLTILEDGSLRWG